MWLFENREAAGQQLAGLLGEYAHRPDVLVLGLPRGGVPVAAEVARVLGVPLDVFLVRKLGVPGHPELAMGAIASGGIRVMNEDVMRWAHVPADAVDAVVRVEQAELERREQEYRTGRPLVALAGRTVILVDDGLATGSTMRAAVEAIRAYGPARVVVAVPVGAPAACLEMASIADELVCARSPEPFSAVGQWYRDFSQTTDAEVRALLDTQARPGAVTLH